ncbi:MAG TPA: hypothetical protein VD886_24955 [Herpetosiphonaceae bacterium]|nr:hypothetical protein [Herpetosiphonaceae bacterium]
MRRILLAVLTLALLAIPAYHIRASTDHVWIDDLSSGTPSSLTGTGTVTLAADAPPAPEYMGTWAQAGEYLSPAHTFSRSVAAVTLDTDTTLPEGTAVRLDVRAQNMLGGWQLWQEAPRGARVAFEYPSSVVQFRLTLLGNGQSPNTRSVAVTAEWGDGAVSMLATAPTYRIYATREGLVGRRTANGHIIQPNDHFVALPSWRSLSSRGGYEYQVRVTYNGRSAVVPVWDVGPWNTHDNYWSTNREMWKDLPRGKPQAQAARLEGYNNGRDERGRRPNLPNGIDIADGTFWALGIPDNAWVEVTFLWEGADPGGGSSAPPSSAPTPTPPPVVPPPAGSSVVDNSDAGFTEVSGTWFDARCGVNNDSHRWTFTASTAAKAENIGEWTAPIASAGFYEVFAYLPACGKPATRNATYSVEHDGKTTKVKLDQEGHQQAWSSLGTYYFQPGNRISLDDFTGERGLSVRYDALAWVPRPDTVPPSDAVPPSDTVPPSAAITGVRDLGDGRFEIIWSGQDDQGVASFDIQVQRDDGPWRDWLLATADTNGTFLVEDVQPSIYSFRARARDWAGNQGNYPDSAQQSTGLGTR